VLLIKEVQWPLGRRRFRLKAPRRRQRARQISRCRTARTTKSRIPRPTRVGAGPRSETGTASSVASACSAALILLSPFGPCSRSKAATLSAGTSISPLVRHACRSPTTIAPEVLIRLPTKCARSGRIPAIRQRTRDRSPSDYSAGRGSFHRFAGCCDPAQSHVVASWPRMHQAGPLAADARSSTLAAAMGSTIRAYDRSTGHPSTSRLRSRWRMLTASCTPVSAIPKRISRAPREGDEHERLPMRVRIVLQAPRSTHESQHIQRREGKVEAEEPAPKQPLYQAAHST